MRIFRLFPIEKNQRIILEKSIEANKDDYNLWFQRFVWAPLLINAVIILIVYFASKKESDIWVQIFNGRLSLIAINIISAMVLLLISKSKDEFKSFEDHTVKLKRKILNWAIIYLVVNAIMYVAQSTYAYWGSMDYITYVLASIFVLILFFLTIFNSVYTFMLTDEVLQNAAGAIDVIINENVRKLGGAIDKY